MPVSYTHLERGAYILKGEEIDKVRKIILNEKGGLNADMVGQSACKIAKMAGVNAVSYTHLFKRIS